jgi:hypothetical protein
MNNFFASNALELIFHILNGADEKASSRKGWTSSRIRFPRLSLVPLSIFA